MKIAIITGASSGMGREAARQLADRFSGLQEVWLIARRMDRMQELERTLPIPARCFSIDLMDASQRETLENELAARKPNVKILVNASGFGKIGTVGNLPLDDETGMVELNCEALCAVTHMVLPYM
ncbi:SDR family oxidoreductase, partial [uncultured Clostridium sp.]